MCIDFDRDFLPPTIIAHGAAGPAMLPGSQTGHLVAHRLPNDASVLNLNGSTGGQDPPNDASVINVNGSTGREDPSLNPSARIFQPAANGEIVDATHLHQTDLGRLPAMGPMSTQQYEVMLDANYVADQRWERSKLLQENDQLQCENEQQWAEQNRCQQTSCRSA